MRVTVVRLLDIPLVDKRFEAGFPNFATQSDADAYLATWLPCAKTVVDVFRKELCNNPSQLVVGEFGGRLCITAKNHHGNLQRSEWPCACEPSRGMLCGFHQNEQDKADRDLLLASFSKLGSGFRPECGHRRGFRSALDLRCIDCGMSAVEMASRPRPPDAGHLESENRPQLLNANGEATVVEVVGTNECNRLNRARYQGSEIEWRGLMVRVVSSEAGYEMGKYVERFVVRGPVSVAPNPPVPVKPKDNGGPLFPSTITSGYAWLPPVKPKSRFDTPDRKWLPMLAQPNLPAFLGQNPGLERQDPKEQSETGVEEFMLHNDQGLAAQTKPPYVHPRSLRGRVNVGALELEDLEDLVAG
jgi:hypothetical protein